MNYIKVGDNYLSNNCFLYITASYSPLSENPARHACCRGTGEDAFIEASCVLLKKKNFKCVIHSLVLLK